MKIIQIKPDDPKIIDIDGNTAEESDYRNMAKMIASIMVKKVVNALRAEETIKTINQ